LPGLWEVAVIHRKVKPATLGLVIAAALVCAPRIALAQEGAAEASHAPDGDSFEQIQSIIIPPVTNAPFTATVTAKWVRKLQDGSEVTTTNHRLVERDGSGRIFQERRWLVPDDGKHEPPVSRLDYSDPIDHVRYFCHPDRRICDELNYFMPASFPEVPVGPSPDHTRTLSRQDLGRNMFEGFDTVGTRETTTIQPGVIGNSRAVSITKEFWYSPELGVNLLVKRIDPRFGTQIFAVTGIQRAEPDPAAFNLPAGYKVVDQRRPRLGAAPSE
jgi:hypothetical protein